MTRTPHLDEVVATRDTSEPLSVTGDGLLLTEAVRLSAVARGRQPLSG
jgi:hypothetical protein